MPQRFFLRYSLVLIVLAVCGATSGCYSPFAADRGALFGGATGAGVGALVGDAVGHPAAGALIGGGVGAITGGAIGQGIDQNRAANAALAAQINQQPPGGVTVDDVVSMTKAGVADELISSQIRSRGVARPITAQDVIVLQQQGVSPQAIQTMQSTPVPAPRVGPPVVGPGPYYGPPPPYYYPYPPPPYYYYPPPPVVGWRFSFR